MKAFHRAAITLGVALIAVQVSRPADEVPGFATSVQPFVAANCATCHNATLKTANLDLMAFKTADSVLANREQWQRILQRITAGEMPPPGMPRPKAVQLTVATKWLEAEFARADKGSGAGRVVARRLNRTEYNNTVRDLLGVDLEAANDFPQDDALYGFDNIANALTVSPLLMEKYLAAAEKIAKAAVFGLNLKPEIVRFYQATPRRFESANATKITEPANFSKDNYDVTGVQMPGSMHKIYKIPVSGEYNVTLYMIGGWPRNSDEHNVDFYVDGKLSGSFQVRNFYTDAQERVPTAVKTRVTLAAGEHYFIAALPRVYEGLPSNYRGPNPSKLPVPERQLAPLPATATAEQIKQREDQLARQRANVPAFDPVAVGELSFEGPFNAAAGPTEESRRKVFVCALKTDACAAQILTSVATRAFRRPVTDTASIIKIAADARKRGRSFEQSLALGIEAILISPDFLFRIEKQTAARLSDYELASRLSYFLWSTMPDETLTRLAKANTLHTPAVLNAQVSRMLADGRSRALAKNFATQWLETRRLESVAPDRDTFPDFDEYLRYSMQQETELFFDNIVRENRSVLDFLDAPYTFLNQRLAEHYGIPNVKGTEFRKVDLTGTNRSGILTQASVLTVSSYGNRTSPVLRGKWVLENILNTPPPPPPPDVPKLDEAKVGTAASLRAQMEAHRANPVCASCHSRMDPIGFALEPFNGVGAFRTKDGGFDIDSSGVMPSGKKFNGASELKTIFKADAGAFTGALTEKLFIYAMGRGVQTTDRPVLNQIAARSAARNHTFASLVLGIVNSTPFQTATREK
jgi:hypothetical protein